MIFTQEAPLTRKWFSGKSCIQPNWNFEMLFFEVRGKPENPAKNLLEERTTNFYPHMATSPESNPGHIAGRRELSPLHHPYSPRTPHITFLTFLFGKMKLLPVHH